MMMSRKDLLKSQYCVQNELLLIYTPRNIVVNAMDGNCFYACTGNDVARSMLVFAKGKPLGPRGLDWLKIHLVNLTGLKKRS